MIRYRVLDSLDRSGFLSLVARHCDPSYISFPNLCYNVSPRGG